jgi:hypothetical protein
MTFWYGLRIRMLGSVTLSQGSGSGSWSCSFGQNPCQCHQTAPAAALFFTSYKDLQRCDEKTRNGSVNFFWLSSFIYQKKKLRLRWMLRAFETLAKNVLPAMASAERCLFRLSQMKMNFFMAHCWRSVFLTKAPFQPYSQSSLCAACT